MKLAFNQQSISTVDDIKKRFAAFNKVTARIRRLRYPEELKELVSLKNI